MIPNNTKKILQRVYNGNSNELSGCSLNCVSDEYEAFRAVYSEEQNALRINIVNIDELNYNIDGGFAHSIYMINQKIDGGNA